MLLYKVEYLKTEEYRKGLMLSMAADAGYSVSAYVDSIDWPCLPSDWPARDNDYDSLMTQVINEALSAQMVEWLNDTSDSHVANLRSSAALEGELPSDFFVGIKMFDFFEALANAKFPDFVLESLKDNAILTEGEVDMTAPTDKIIEQIKDSETVMKEIKDGVNKLGGKRRIKLVATYNGQY